MPALSAPQLLFSNYLTVSFSNLPSGHFGQLDLSAIQCEIQGWNTSRISRIFQNPFQTIIFAAKMLLCILGHLVLRLQEVMVVLTILNLAGPDMGDGRFAAALNGGQAERVAHRCAVITDRH
jgi:hypothetical protein